MIDGFINSTDEVKYLDVQDILRLKISVSTMLDALVGIKNPSSSSKLNLKD